MTRKTSPVTIIGAGHAAGELATALRQAGHEGPVGIIGDEAYLPYQRPPLSKAFLAGKVEVAGLLLRPQATYDGVGIEMQLGCRVTAIDRQKRMLQLDGDREQPFDLLVLATGGRPRPLPARNADIAATLPNFHYLRTIDDVRRITASFKPGCRLAIVGGGYVGLEVAAVARQHNIDVTVLEAAPRVLARVTAPDVSAFYEQVHRDAGVHLLTSTVVDEVVVDEAAGRVSGLRCADGRSVDADFFIVGIGLIPNVELARDAGLEVDDGIVVDALCRTSDPDILAIGDCTRHPNAYAGRMLRLESVPSAVEQARTAAATLTGQHKPYEAVPWFWSEQYDMRLQVAGLSQGYDRTVLRGDPSMRSFSAFYMREGRLIAADVVSRPAEFMLARQAVARGVHPDPEALADESIPLKSVLT
ncbi:NAD(P)/FAD-dependent oxidoreductase [Cupriavidus necator]